jgi:thiol-disulfide isomerase/thioredoxin
MTTHPVNRAARRLFPLLGVALGLALGALFSGGAAASEPAAPLVVKIHADWCGTCTRMAPSWNSVSTSLGSKARFVVLDVTDAGKLDLANAEAERLGIRGFFDGHKSKTGTVGILDATGHPVAVFKGELDADAVGAAVDRARAEGEEQGA